MKLRIREAGPTLPKRDAPAMPTELPLDERNLWRDSSIDLERGLDVVEHSIDIVLPEDQKPPTE